MNVLDLLASLLTLTVLEIVLGIDNLVLLSILTERLPVSERKKARRWGLSFAWITRLLLLFSALAIAKLTQPIAIILGTAFSFRQLLFIVGGLFLIVKATQEIHYEISQDKEEIQGHGSKGTNFFAVVLQVGLMDIVFSFDSVLTALGLTNNFWIMATAITGAILVMIFASEAVSRFIAKYPTIKMLALSFLLLIGGLLIADGFNIHMPREYLYFTMAFSVSVELLNLVRGRRRVSRRSP